VNELMEQRLVKYAMKVEKQKEEIEQLKQTIKEKIVVIT
jgi:hypothetical protein